METEESIREIFLKSFIKAVIDSVEVPKVEKQENFIEIKRLPESGMIESRQIKEVQMPSPRPFQRIMPQRVPIQIRKIESPMLIRKAMLDSNEPATQNMEDKQGFQKSVMDSGVREEPINFVKIKPFLHDPSVSSIECTGPEKPILINKSGIIQTTSITLTQQEITQVVEEVSNRTRIPIVLGSFKAAFGNYIMTAVLSDFVGTRFLIQKKSPQPGIPYRQ